MREVFAEQVAIQELEAAHATVPYGTGRDMELQDEIQARREAYRVNLWGEYKQVTSKLSSRTIMATKKVTDGKWEYVVPYLEPSYDASIENLERILDWEAENKYDFIIERTCTIVGEITGASGLYIGGKQELNGVIIGTKGKAKVLTIGAGGYNIHCFHFRTLITPIDG